MIKHGLLLMAVLALSAPARAGEAPHGDAPQPSAAAGALGADESCPRNLETPPVAIPVTAGDRLTGYAFIVPRICLNRSSRFDHLANVHFLTDRFLRAAHRTPFQAQADGQVDREATQAAMLEAAGEFIPLEDIDRLDLLGQDVRSIR
jgi:hypothetical protein